MKAKIKIETEVELKTLCVDAGVRYWEDADVNGVQDELGDLMPCRYGERWRPIIDIETGIILNWKKGTKADVHYKVCDDGKYTLKDAKGKSIITVDGYVPNTMSPAETGYGDYIIMHIDENGKIADWEFNIDDFKNEDED